MESYKHTVKFLKKQRLKNNMSQRHLAEALNFSTPQYVSNWERNPHSLPWSVLPRLVKILDIKPNDLIAVMMADQEAEFRRMFKGL